MTTTNAEKVFRLAGSAKKLLEDAMVLMDGAKAILESDDVEYYQIDPDGCAGDLMSYGMKEHLDCGFDDVKTIITALNEQRRKIAKKITKRR